MEGDLLISTTTDTLAQAKAAAHDDEQAARRPASKPEAQQLDGSSSVSFEHSRSERRMLLERLAQDNADLADLTTPQPEQEQISSISSTEAEGQAGEGEQPTDGEADLEAVRQAAIQQAIADGPRLVAQQQPQPWQASAEQWQTHLEKIEKLKAKTPDFDAVIAAAQRITIPEAVRDAMVKRPGGAEAGLYLATHPEEAQKFSTLPLEDALVKTGELCARMAAGSRRPASKAAAPIKPVGSSSTKSSVPADEMPYQEFVKFREREIKNRYRR
jgi:hypothetical protein